jgi:Tol biopolymer transport system component
MDEIRQTSDTRGIPGRPPGRYRSRQEELMTRALMVMGAAVLAGTALLGQQRPAAASLDRARLEAAINKEVIDGDLKAAIDMYQELTQSADRAVAAQSYLRLGQGYRRLGDPQSKPALQRALEFKDQPQVVAKARAALGQSVQGGASAPGNAVAMRRLWAGDGVDTSGAVSPDGRTLAYVDRDTGDLAVRDLETGSNRRLTVDGNNWEQWAQSTAFSPDGQQIAFVWWAKTKRDEIRIVDAKGTNLAVPRRLVDRPDIDWFNVTDWSRDGKWLAATYGKAGGQVHLARIVVADGTVQELRALDSRPTKVLFSPDGRYVAYDVLRDNNADDRDIVVRGLLDRTESYVASAPGYEVLMGWSPDGSMLVFASDRSGVNSLWVTTMHEGKASSEPRKVYANVGDEALGLTVRGALFVGVTAGRLELNLVVVDAATGKRLGEPERPVHARIGPTRSPSWSRDGTQLAFAVMGGRAGQGRMLAVRDTRTGHVRDLQTSLQNVNFPRWSPDGRYIVVQGTDRTGADGIFRIAVDTGEVMPVVKSSDGVFNFWPSWSADGQRVYFSRSSKGGQTSAIERDLETGREREFSGVRSGIASPDGRFLLESPWRDGRIAELKLVPTAGGDPRVVYGVSEGGLPWADWTPDGKHILVKHVGKDRDDVLLIPIDGGAPVKLDLPGARWGWMAMHPDGKRIAYLAGKQEEEVWVIENFLPQAKAAIR